MTPPLGLNRANVLSIDGVGVTGFSCREFIPFYFNAFYFIAFYLLPFSMPSKYICTVSSWFSV